MEQKLYKNSKEICELYPIKLYNLRKYVRENTQGIHRAVYKVGGNILFDLEEFDKWFQERRLAKE
jgi:hypothetical protein